MPSDKCQIFPQIDIIILGVGPDMPTLPKITIFIFFFFFLQYFKKEVSDEIDFLYTNKHESLLQIDTMTLIGIVKHSQSYQNSKVTMPLRYIKKEVRKGVHY